jgi:hypothetical protein
LQEKVYCKPIACSAVVLPQLGGRFVLPMGEAWIGIPHESEPHEDTYIKLGKTDDDFEGTHHETLQIIDP